MSKLNVCPITRIGSLLAKKLCRRKPNSSVVRNYATAIRELCDARSGSDTTVSWKGGNVFGDSRGA
jgi:hypothetical protein